MTVKALIHKTDALFPNVMSFAQKSALLYELDSKLYHSFLSHYENAGEFSATPSEADRQLLVCEPFCDLYHYYLCMQLELAGGNITGYQNQAALFNSAYLSFMNHYNRTHNTHDVRINC